MGAGRPKSIDNTKVFDVAKPGKAKPLSTSRPVVSQQVTVKDHSMLTTPGVGGDPVTALSPPSVTRKVIKPISGDEITEAAEQKAGSVVNFTETAPELNVAVDTVPPEVQVTKKEAKKLQIVDSTTNGSVAVARKETAKIIPEPVEESVAAENPEAEESEAAPSLSSEKSSNEAEGATESDEAKTTPAANAEEPESESNEESASEGSDAASVDALAEASEKPKLEQKLQEEQAKRDAALQELIDSKKYFVPLARDSSKPKKGSGVGIVMLVLLLLVVAAYVLVDAEIIKTNISLPYQFIK